MELEGVIDALQLAYAEAKHGEIMKPWRRLYVDPSIAEGGIDAVDDVPAQVEGRDAPDLFTGEQIELPSGGEANGFRAQHMLAETVNPVAHAFLAQAVVGETGDEERRVSLEGGDKLGARGRCFTEEQGGADDAGVAHAVPVVGAVHPPEAATVAGADALQIGFEDACLHFATNACARFWLKAVAKQPVGGGEIPCPGSGGEIDVVVGVVPGFASEGVGGDGPRRLIQNVGKLAFDQREIAGVIQEAFGKGEGAKAAGLVAEGLFIFPTLAGAGELVVEIFGECGIGLFGEFFGLRDERLPGGADFPWIPEDAVAEGRGEVSRLRREHRGDRRDARWVKRRQGVLGGLCTQRDQDGQQKKGKNTHREKSRERRSRGR